MAKVKEDLFNLIHKCEGRLSNKKRMVAKYILDNPIETAFLTAAKLAKRAGVSEPTVVRFAADLGFNGYPELREALHRIAQGRLTTVERLKEYHRYLEDSEDPVIKIILMDLRNLEETLHNLDITGIQQTVEEIIAAEKIIIIGSRMSSILVEFMRMILKKSLSCEVTTVTSPSDFFHEELVYSPKKTLVIGIGFPRYTRLTVDCLKMAHDEGFRTIAITDSELSPLVKHADQVLLARYGTISYIDSFTAPFSLISAIGTAVSLQMEPQILERLKRLEQMWKEHQVFY